jgi:hypothetical protein
MNVGKWGSGETESTAKSENNIRKNIKPTRKIAHDSRLWNDARLEGE